MHSADTQSQPVMRAVRVSFICTANRARSPFAAALLRRHLTAIPVVVDSFGTMEREGDPALPKAIRAARSFGVDLMPHRARSVSPGSLRTSDLVVGFEQFHVAHSVVTGGADRSRAFLLPELALMLEEVAVPPHDANGVDLVLGRVNAVRGASSGGPSAIGDPVGGSDRRFLETYESIESMVEIVAVRLFGAGT